MTKNNQSNLRRFKYLVGYNEKLDQFEIGYTREWQYHFQIADAFLPGFHPYSGGYFTAELGGHKWVPNSVDTDGKSEGFNLYPHDRDVGLLERMLDGENTGEFIRLFDSTGNPLIGELLEKF